MIIWRIPFRWAWLAAAVGLGGWCPDYAEELHSLSCDKTRFFRAPMDASDHRKYAPDREIDILNLLIDVTPDFDKRTVSGRAVLTFRPIAKALSQLRLDAVDLRVESVTATARVQAYQNTGQQLLITFAEPIPAQREASVTVTYSAEPARGLYFRTPAMGYKEGDAHLFTQGEPIEARHWYPCFDAPNEKFTSEVICRVPEGMTVLSNGKRLSERKDGATGLMAVHWRQETPHVNYLISLLAGHFEKIEDRYQEVPLAFYTPPSLIQEAANSFRDTKDAMAYFEREIGVAYPWVKYYQVCVNDFVAGGMENTSITTLTDHTLFSEATENLRSSQDLVAHELVHQWFGDLVTCKDWSHLWLNEGFATYYAHLFDGHKNGRDAMLYGLYQDAKDITGRSDDTKPIVDRKFDHPNEQFSYLAYPKGSWVLHMLRSQLGEDLFRRCIKTYLDRHQYDTVVTEDLNAVVEELSGRSYDRFFDQWVYHAHHPELDISYSWDEAAKLARISVAQNQKLSETVLLFHFPLTVRFQVDGRFVERQIRVQEKSEDFYFGLPAAPKGVRIDPEFTLLARIKFHPPESMLQEQLTDRSDVVGRLLAIEQLAEKKDGGAVMKLKTALQEDPFHGVRIEAARALRAIHSDAAYEALAECLEQPDARVRRQVVSVLAGFYRVEAYEAARRQVDREKNPDILGTALRALGTYPKPEVKEILVRFLDSQSFRNTLADAAIAAMRTQDDPAYIAPLLAALREREARFTSSGYGRGLETLAHLARHEERKETVRDFLLGFVNSPKRPVQLAAMRALGTLGDAKAIPVLQTFASAGKDNPATEPASRAIAALRAARQPSDEWRELRTELLELQKSNRELQKQLEELKKKVDAAPAPAAAGAASANGSAEPKAAASAGAGPGREEGSR